MAADLGLNTAEVPAYILGPIPTAIPGSPSGTVRVRGDHLRLID